MSKCKKSFKCKMSPTYERKKNKSDLRVEDDEGYNKRTCRECQGDTRYTVDGMCRECLSKNYSHLCSPCLTCRLPISRDADICDVCLPEVTKWCKKLGVKISPKKFGLRLEKCAYISAIPREVYAGVTLVETLPVITDVSHANPDLSCGEFPGFYFGNGVWKEPSREELLNMNRYGILTTVGSQTKCSKQSCSASSPTSTQISEELS